MTTWEQDVLGAGFECTTFALGDDDDPAAGAPSPNGQTARPALVATLVRALPDPLRWKERIRRRRRDFEDVDVLYVHGWSDYFFQKHLAHFWTERGARFFALDLRRYGRSLREGQTPGYVGDLTDYDTEINLAVQEIRQSRAPGEARNLVLLGHSTGGLVLSLWCGRNAGEADALILNSPWIELQITALGRQLIAPIVNIGARFSPLDAAPQLDYGFYSRAQMTVGPQDDLEGINELWRPPQTNAVHSGWLRAILAGHDAVSRGLGIDVPVCVLLSARSGIPSRWSDELTQVDSVLDVDSIAKAALQLGSSVTVERIDGALHDVFLSAEAPRAEAYARLDRWARGWRHTLRTRSR